MRGDGVRRVAPVLVTVVLAIALAACGGGSTDGNPGALFPDRPNQYREDQERALGDAARLSGYTTTVESVAYDGAGEVTVSVRVENRDDELQPMSSTDWRLVSPGGHTYDAVSSTLPATGQVDDTPVVGDVVFRVDPLPAEAQGDFYVLYKPDALDAAQGVWSFTVPDAEAPAEAP